MALRMWTQISSVKCIRRQAAAVNLGGAHETGIRHMAKSSGSGPEEDAERPRGRFVRDAPGPGDPAMLQLRPLVRRRVQHGARHVQENARLGTMQRTAALARKKYVLRTGSEFTANHEQMQQLKREYVRQQSVASLQPYHQVPFCSKSAKTFFREDVGPNRSFLIGTAPKREMSSMASSRYLKDSTSMTYDGISVSTKDVEMELADKEMASDADSDLVSDVLTVYSQHSSHSQQSVQSQQSVLSAESAMSMLEEDDPNQTLSTLISNPDPPKKSYVGNSYTKYLGRSYSTSTRLTAFPPQQVRTMARIKNYPGPKECKDSDKNDPKKDEKPYKHDGRWTKCECCPEMLPCDEIVCLKEESFPCPPEDPICPGPPDCPPPPIPPPPRKIPLPKLCKREVYHCTKECTGGCEDIPICQFVVPKTLPAMKKGNCMCREDPPMTSVEMVRLPPICLCPKPPDPKCADDKCAIRADEVCKWKFPVKKLKNFWCPHKPIPPNPYKWCQCHTRTHPDCKKGEKGVPVKDDE